MSPEAIDKLFEHLDRVYPQSPVRSRTKNIGAWVFGQFYFSLTKQGGKCNPHVLLSDVWVPPNCRHEGYATAGMAELMGTLDSKSYRVAAVLRVRSYDKGIPPKKLREFYVAHGFQPTGKDKNQMYRRPL